MAGKEIKPNDPQATELATADERDDAERKSQAIDPRSREAGRKTHGRRWGH